MWRAGYGGTGTGGCLASVQGVMLGWQGCVRRGGPYEEGGRVPLIVRFPGGEGKGVEPEPISLVELGAWTEAWAEGRRPRPSGSPVAISMPSVVALPWQCDRVWSGWRSRTRKEVFSADGRPWLCLLNPSDAADELPRSVRAVCGGSVKKKNKSEIKRGLL